MDVNKNNNGQFDIFGKLSSTYQDMLSRFNKQRSEISSSFAGAEAPIQEMVGLFREGGGYGAGQNALIEAEGKKAYGAGLGDLVSTGMSSGTNATGLRARIGRDVTTAKLGVEDQRVGQLAQALGLLGQFKTSQASAISNSQQFDYAPYMGALTSAYATQQQTQASRLGSVLNYINQRKQIRSSEKIAKMQTESQSAERQHFNTPW